MSKQYYVHLLIDNDTSTNQILHEVFVNIVTVLDTNGLINIQVLYYYNL